MLLKNKSSYTLATADELSFEVFLKSFETAYNNLKSSHLILDLTLLEPINPQDVNKLLDCASQSQKLKKSFIVIVENIAIDDVSEALICVPTLLEAQDTFEMEEMERDLGF
jgi:hypothetical protein